MVASRAPKSPEKAMAIILFSILAVVIVLTSLTTSTYSPSSSSSTSSSRHVNDPLGLPHFVTHEVRDDPVGSWVHHAWEATEHVVDEVAEEFEEFGEDTARVFEPRVFEPRETNPRRAGTFGRERRGRDGRLEKDDWNVDDEGRAARRRENGGSGARARAEGGMKHHG